jgi:cysteine desulfurase / selenocysteine lyase
VTAHPAIKTGAYDVAKLRADFPILSLKVYDNKSLIYLDNAASAQKPKAVLDRMREAYEREYANVHRGLHYLANAATEGYEGARESVRKFLNAKSTSEIVFTKNATEAINLVAASFGLKHIGEGDEIVLSIMEHHSNIVPWHYYRERKGAVLKWAPLDEDGNLDVEAFEKLLTKRTKIVAITQMSNVLGTVVPIKEIVKIAHARNIPVLVDGSQAAVHLNVDVQDLGCDFYVFTGHKLYGPSGIGALYAKSPWLAELPPFLGGGEMIREVTEDRITWADPPYKFEAGTPPIVPAIGLAAAIDYVGAIGKDKIAAHEQSLLKYATEQLSRINSIKIMGRPREKGALISFEMKGAHPHDVATVIDRSGIAIRAGTHCALPLLNRYGCTASCRASFALYNTQEEVDSFAEALLKAQDMFS